MNVINFNGQNFSAHTTLGLLTGIIYADGSLSVGTPRSLEGKDTFVEISRINYRFDMGFRADGGTVGGCLIYREGRWSSGEGVTSKAQSVIWELTRSVYESVKYHAGFEGALYTAKQKAKESEIAHLERQIAELQAKVAKLREE